MIIPRPEGLRAAIELCVKALRGTKEIDLFESARVTRTTSIPEQMKALKGLIEEGLIGHIGLSECSAATIREANEHAPIAAVEIEVSPWSYEEETKKGTAYHMRLAWRPGLNSIIASDRNLC